MSKKRDKNQRKKQTKARPKKRGAPRPTTSDAAGQQARDINAVLEADYRPPTAQAPAASGGAIGRMKDFMTHSDEGPEAHMLHKRRSCAELSLWLAGGMGICWLILYLFQE